MTAARIQKLRRGITSLDRQIVDLLNRRAAHAAEVGAHKRRAQADRSMCRPDRETQILRAVHKASKGPLRPEHLERIYRELISACLSLEAEVRIGFLGPEGTFSHEAALAQFGQSASYLPMESIGEIVSSVEKSTCDFGIVPVENSTEGTVGQTLDVMFEAPVLVCAERVVRIRQHLLAKRHVDLGSVKTVYSHPQSFAQCRGWLRAHLPNAETVDCASNAVAARRIRRASSASCAAIGPRNAAEIYGLGILAHDIEDDPRNNTRFWVVGRSEMDPTGRDTTSIAMAAAADRAGGLLELLAPLAKNNVNMSKLESRPSPIGKMWEYLFFIDFEGHRADANVARALAFIERRAAVLKVLGSYPTSR